MDRTKKIVLAKSIPNSPHKILVIVKYLNNSIGKYGMELPLGHFQVNVILHKFQLRKFRSFKSASNLQPHILCLECIQIQYLKYCSSNKETQL